MRSDERSGAGAFRLRATDDLGRGEGQDPGQAGGYLEHPARNLERAGRFASEDGNTLILMPVAVLILLMLGSIALDGAIAFMADRELNDVASGLANDAAVLIEESTFYDEGEVVISQDRVDTLLAQVVPLLQDDPLSFTCTGLVTAAGDRVTVRCVGRTELLFLPALPGSSTLGEVEATATARAERG